MRLAVKSMMSATIRIEGVRRVDIGVADHKLFEDVVLDRAREFFGRHALLFAGDDEGGEHRQHRAVHGHRHAHRAERDAVEEDFHILDAVDRDAGHADIAGDARMIAVIAAMGREIESDRETVLALAQDSRGKTRSNSSAVEKPAYWRKVHGRPAYIVARTPRVNGGKPGKVEVSICSRSAAV